MRCPVAGSRASVVGVLSAEQVDDFVRDGFVRLEGAVPRDVLDQCIGELWEASGCNPDDRSTWTQPVIRLDYLGTPAFRAAANGRALHEAFDQLVGPNRWRPREGLGTFPLRFPSDRPPDDAGWHLEGSFEGPDGR